MTHPLVVLFILAAAIGFAACDAVPSASASAGHAETEPFTLRDGMTVESDSETVRLTVDGERITLRAVEMFALTQVAHRAAYDALSAEQRDIYLSGEHTPPEPGRGGGRCFPDGDFVFAGHGGGGSPCPPPPPMVLSRDLADLFYGDSFQIGEHPGRDADWREAAGGFVY